MKKHLIAAAVAAAVAVPAMAQVTMSGRIDTSLGSSTAKDNRKDTRLLRNTLTTNQLVLSGAEDLGGGLKANFNIVSGFESTKGGTITFGDRGAHVGVSGGFGAVNFGKHPGNMLNTIQAGVIGNPLDIGGITLARPDNMISYTLPTMNGLTAQVIYSLAQTEGTPTASKKGQQTEGSLQFVSGPLTLRAAYNVNSNVNVAAGTAAALNQYGTSSTSSAVVDAKITETGIQAIYNLGVATVNLRTVQRTLTDKPTDNSTSYGLAVTVPMGSTTFGGEFVNVDSKKALDAGDVKRMGVTVSNALSKRTNVYAAYTKNDHVNSSTVFDESLTAVGVRHSF